MDDVISGLLDCGAAHATLTGQSVHGDRHLFHDFRAGALVAVVDGLGHGEEAAQAAMRAVATMRECAHQPVLRIIQSCHEALRTTRGAVMSLASFKRDEQTMVWAGVGNVEGLLVRADLAANPASEMLLLRGGVVGHKLPALTASIVPVAKGDTLIFATDGVGSGFWRDLGHTSDSPQRLSDRILAQHATGADDALVVAARYCG